MECGLHTSSLKKHVLRYYISKVYWFVYPLQACWTCRTFEIKSHARDHGPYSDKYSYKYAGLVLKLSAALCSRIGVTTNEQLLQLVHGERCGVGAAVVNEEELLMMNGYDQLQGLSPLNKRNLFKTSRVSTLLHWKLLQHLLIYSTRKSVAAVTTLVSTDQATSLVVSVDTRRVTFQEKKAPLQSTSAPKKLDPVCVSIQASCS